jgi:hypothetical protein
MDISRETPTQTNARLLRVIAAAEVTHYDEPYVFVETPRGSSPPIGETTLALIRDDEVWSSLQPARQGTNGEHFALMRFQFPGGLDNSGFVGWLASELKRRLGTGILVVCGQNSGRGGIFDYWGCPP